MKFSNIFAIAAGVLMTASEANAGYFSQTFNVSTNGSYPDLSTVVRGIPGGDYYISWNGPFDNVINPDTYVTDYVHISFVYQSGATYLLDGVPIDAVTDFGYDYEFFNLEFTDAGHVEFNIPPTYGYNVPDSCYMGYCIQNEYNFGINSAQPSGDYMEGSPSIMVSSYHYIAGNYSFTISSVPEPATWVLMMVGAGGLGATLRSKRREVAACQLST